MKIGKNKAKILMQHIPLYNLYDDRVDGYKRPFEIENFNYDEVIYYLAELEVPYNVIKKFFDEKIKFSDMDGNKKDDEADFFGIDKKGIYCWTEVEGNKYYLNDYGKTWKEVK